MDIFVIDPLLFGLAFFLLKGRTYGILLLATICNILIYPFTSPESVILPATLDFIVIMSLIVFGDKHRYYQIGILFIALACHSLPIGNYDLVVIGLTIMQLMGAGYGILERVWRNIDANPIFDYRTNQVYFS